MPRRVGERQEAVRAVAVQRQAVEQTEGVVELPALHPFVIPREANLAEEHAAEQPDVPQGDDAER